ncbi:hypothetical protein PK98_04010 [Croceibacterium mercuriale]|uniref:Uncharacterized protein n=1 Tax=Croceibacterium mercuriale TaxID=1572751 RepID=A0A0B2C0K7_9SPHN|nr:hypothetical protein [Croceibacterium mercuriale]KHL25787.1 hypothetical protein PK98_04010 [Croceibacterium mercuriale]
MRIVAATIVLALVASLATAWISPATDERAMYGLEGPLEANWRSRKVAGWPAPFLADDPGTSVPHHIGLEDTFRPGPFIATFSFWFLVISAVVRLARWGTHTLRQRL